MGRGLFFKKRSKVFDVLKFGVCVQTFSRPTKEDTKTFLRLRVLFLKKRSKVFDVLKFGFLQTSAKLCILNEGIRSDGNTTCF